MSTKGPVQFSTTSNDLQFYRSFNKLIGANRFINGKPYPKLTARGKFVPLRSEAFFKSLFYI